MGTNYRKYTNFSNFKSHKLLQKWPKFAKTVIHSAHESLYSQVIILFCAHFEMVRKLDVVASICSSRYEIFGNQGNLIPSEGLS